MKFLNLACGPIYIASDSWTNVDFEAVGCEVIGHDLLKPLPFDSGCFDLVYSSHFLEHLPRTHVQGFLLECLRVLKPGGVIRLVLPDSEEMFSTFLCLRAEGRHPEADFLMIEIIDQCVRSYAGGELGSFYSKIHAMDSASKVSWIRFVASRTGETLETVNPELSTTQSSKTQVRFRNGLVSRIVGLPQKFSKRIRLKFHQLGLMLLLPAFRRQNVSLAGIGEKHCWLWDFFQLRRSLIEAGFSSVSRKTHLTSSLTEFPFIPLDSTADGLPRKGKESMYVEARSAV